MRGEGTFRKISRVEFVPANFASLIIALAWAYTPGMDGWGLVLPLFLAFAIISLVSIAGAHLNTYSDAELDRKDPTKERLVEALENYGKGRLRRLMALEVAASALFMAPMLVIRPNPALLLAYTGAIFFAYAYSMPPLRFKGRSLLAMCSLMLVLSIIPITFTYGVVAQALDPLFLLFLAGQCMIIYGLIIPTEIRDHDWDMGMGIRTMTVWLGIGRASLFGLALLCAGMALMGAAFLMESLALGLPLLGCFLVVPAAAVVYVMRQFSRIHSLSKSYPSDPAKEWIVALASKNPRWITLVSQSIVLISLALLAAKILP